MHGKKKKKGRRNNALARTTFAPTTISVTLLGLTKAKPKLRGQRGLSIFKGGTLEESTSLKGERGREAKV